MVALPLVEVNIWSDVACPWCWVGFKRYQKATASLSGKAQVVTKFHPYMIDPATKRSGEEYLAYNQRRWGSDGWTHSLRRSGAPDGATFSDWQWWPHTLKAHQLIQIADEEDRGVEAKEALLKATYEEGKNVSQTDIIQQIAESLAIAVEGKLDSETYGRKVIAEDKHAKNDLDIHGVPHFVIGSGSKSVALHGAQSTAALTQALLQQL